MVAGRLSTPTDDGRHLALTGLGFSFTNGLCFDGRPPVRRLLVQLLQLENDTQTSTAAPRPGTAAVVKTSAGLDVVSVRPCGSVVHPDLRASSSYALRVHKRSALASLRQLRVQECPT